EDEQGGLRLAAERSLPGICELLGFQAMIFEQARQALARSPRVAREHDLVSASAEIGDVRSNRFVDIRLLGALRREITRSLHSEVDHAVRFRLREMRGEVDWPVRDEACKFSLGEIECIWFERSIAPR